MSVEIHNIHTNYTLWMVRASESSPLTSACVMRCQCVRRLLLRADWNIHIAAIVHAMGRHHDGRSSQLSGWWRRRRRLCCGGACVCMAAHKHRGERLYSIISGFVFFFAVNIYFELSCESLYTFPCCWSRRVSPPLPPIFGVNYCGLFLYLAAADANELNWFSADQEYIEMVELYKLYAYL